jgi:hypothetical protein
MKQGISRVWLACLLLIIAGRSSHAAAGELQEFRCGKALIKDGVQPQLVVDDKLHVLEQTRLGDQFDPGPPLPGYRVTSIFCARSDIVPAPDDYKVVQAGYPLTIFARDPKDRGQTRIAVLELDGGQLRMRSVGELGFTPEMTQRIQAFLNSSLPRFGKVGPSQ